MQSTVSRFVSWLVFSSLMGMLLPASVVYADFLVRPAVVFVEPPPCGHYVRVYPKKQHVIHKHYKHRRCHICGYRSEIIRPCVYRYYPQAEIVAFVPGVPYGRGVYVDTSGCDNYDPDMSTGDDDPTIYPGMDIDN